MANCSVLEAHQKVTDKPTRRIKRSGGHSLVRHGLAVWIKENVLLIMRGQPIAQPHANTRVTPLKSTPNSPGSYIQHHIEPKIYKVNRRQMEELERWYASVGNPERTHQKISKRQSGRTAKRKHTL